MTVARALVVDDEAGVRFGIREYLEAHGLTVEEAASCDEARAALHRSRPDAVILDYLLPDGDAFDLLPLLHDHEPPVPLVLLTAHGSVELAVRAVKAGAENVLTKPVEMASLLLVVERLVELDRSRRRHLAGRSRRSRRPIDPFCGESPLIRRLEEQARRALASESPILLIGETGTGKGVLARWLHDEGARADEAFVDINCAGLRAEFLDTELFGHERGAFTGATARKPGLVEVAHRGTLFLDEIGEVDLSVQPKLLKVLDEKKFRRLGDVRDRFSDVRLIAATHCDLGGMMQEGAFRSDLYYRISALPLVIPPLRERPEDLSRLGRAMLAELAAELGRGGITLGPDAEAALCQRPWPGNFRELRNTLERALLQAEGNVLRREDLRFDEIAPEGNRDSTDLTLAEAEARHIRRALRRAEGRVAEAASSLDVPRSTLYERIKRYGIEPSDYRNGRP